MTQPASTEQKNIKDKFVGVVGSLKKNAIAKPVAFALAYAALGSIAFEAMKILGAGGTPAQGRLLSAVVASVLCAVSDRIRPEKSSMSTGRAAMAGFCVGPWFPLAATLYSSAEVYFGLKAFSAKAEAEAEKLSPKAPMIDIKKKAAKMS